MNNTQKEEEKSFHNPCPYGNDDCPKCVSTPPADSNLELNSNTNIEDLAEKEEWGAWKIVSDMLDNPGEYGIYQTSKCYKELYNFVCLQKEKTRIKTEEYMLKNHLSSLKSLLQQERHKEREKMIGEKEQLLKEVLKFVPVENQVKLLEIVLEIKNKE